MSLSPPGTEKQQRPHSLPERTAPPWAMPSPCPSTLAALASLVFFCRPFIFPLQAWVLPAPPRWPPWSSWMSIKSHFLKEPNPSPTKNNNLVPTTPSAPPSSPLSGFAFLQWTSACTVLYKWLIYLLSNAEGNYGGLGGGGAVGTGGEGGRINLREELTNLPWANTPCGFSSAENKVSQVFWQDFTCLESR